MRVLTQNVLMGGEDRFDALCDVLRAARPDLLVLQECLGWQDGVRLRTLAHCCDIPEDDRHLFLSQSNPRGSGKRYHVALLSRAAILTVRAHTDGFAHSVLDATVAVPTTASPGPGPTLRILGAHLVSSHEDARLAETDVLLSLVLASLARGEDLIVAGDLNSLSPRDPYPADLAERFVQLGISKYGNPPRFDVLRRLFSVGLLDSFDRRKPDAPWASAVRGRRDGGPDQGLRVLTRTDYVLLSARLAQRLVDGGIVDVGQASDHHAVYADLNDSHHFSENEDVNQTSDARSGQSS